MKKIKKVFLAGLFTTLPAIVTFYVIYLTFNFFDGLAKGLIQSVVGFHIPGTGVLLTLAMILGLGYITNHYLGKGLFQQFERLMMNIPAVNIMYKALKDVSTTLSKKSTEGFSYAVTVEFPMKGVTSLGFVTNESIKYNTADKVAVFIPTTPNPTNGFLIFVNPDQVERSALSVDEAIKCVISMGSVGHKL